MRVLIICLVFILFGCNYERAHEHQSSRLFLSNDELIEADKLTYAELAAVESELDVAGFILKLNSFLWRDFMPGTELDTSLTATLELIEQRFQNISEFQLTAIYIVNGSEVWFSEVKPQTDKDDYIYTANYRADGGPKWNTGIFVDVIGVVQFNSGTYFLKSPKQYIEETH